MILVSLFSAIFDFPDRLCRGGPLWPPQRGATPTVAIQERLTFDYW